MPTLRSFSRVTDLEAAALALLLETCASRAPAEPILLLSGGRTPLGLYRRWAADPRRCAPARILLADERHVPPDAAESNARELLPLARALGLPDAGLLRPRTELPLDEAAARYDGELRPLLAAGLRPALGFLGLGADGHTASLFSAADVSAGNGLLAQAVRRPSGPDRISVTANLLGRFERLVFLVVGPDKTEALDRLLREPDSIAAGLAVRGAAQVEVYSCPSPD